MRVNIHEAKSNLSKLVAAVEDEGAEVTLCRAGRPAARLSPLPPKKAPKGIKFGVLAGEIEISESFYQDIAEFNGVFGVT